MSRRIAIMNLGVLQQVGTPLDVYNHPATLFVAGFIGSPPMNFVDCTLVDGDVPQLLDVESGFRYTLTPQQRDMIRAQTGDGELVFGVRSEDVRIATGPDSNGLRAEVYTREPLGDEVIYDLKIGEKVVRAKTEPTLRLNVGDNVGIAFEPGRTHVFSKETGQAVF